MDCELFDYLEFPKPSKAYQVAASKQNTGILAPCADLIPKTFQFMLLKRCATVDHGFLYEALGKRKRTCRPRSQKRGTSMCKWCGFVSLAYGSQM